MTFPPSSTMTAAQKPLKSIMSDPARRGKSSSGSSSGRRRVSFSPRIRGRQIGHLADMTQDEVDSLWYTKEDQDQLAHDMIATIRNMRAMRSNQLQRLSLHEGQEETCYRGLEHMMSSKSLEDQAQAKNRSIRAVLTEQSHQRKSGVMCPTTLAIIAAQASHDHRQTALVHGEEDAASTRRNLRNEHRQDVLSRAINIAHQSPLVTADAATTSTTNTAPVVHPGIKRASSSQQLMEQRRQGFLQQVANNQKRRRSLGHIDFASPNAKSA